MTAEHPESAVQKRNPEEDAHANPTRPRNTFAKSYGSFIICMIIIVIFIASLVGVFVYQYYESQRMREPALTVEPEEVNNLIYIDPRDEKSLKSVEKQLNDFFKDYSEQSSTYHSGRNYTNCDYATKKNPGQFCIVPPTSFPCVAENKYGFHKRTPCLFLKIDNALNWKPDCYNTTENLPSDMPLSLIEFIKKEEMRNSTLLNKIWVSCKGETLHDDELIGPIQYYPTKGFPSYYFPKETLDTLSPIVSLHLLRPKLGVLLNIECRIWAKNIVNDKILIKLMVE